MTHTSWMPGLWVLAASFACAALFLWAMRRRAAPLLEQGEKRADHERQVAVAMEQLQELSAEAHHHSPDQLSSQRSALEQAAAAALRAQEVPTPAPTDLQHSAKPMSPALGFWAQHPTLKGALIGAGVAVFFGGMAVWVSQSSKPRGDKEEMTGMRPRGEMPAEPEAENQNLQEARRKFQAAPNNPDASAQLAHELLRSQEFSEATELTQKALAGHPHHLETLIHAAVLKGIRGQPQVALEELEGLGKRKEDNATEAWLFAGALALDLKDFRRALKAFEAYAERVPASEHPPALRQGIALIRQQVAAMDGKPFDAVPGKPLPKDHPPVAGQTSAGADGPPPLTAETIEAVTSVEKTPELLAGLAKRVEEAEADLAQKRFQDALDKYKQVIPVQPDNGRARAGMAWALIGLGKPVAERIWQVAVTSDPNAVKALGETLARRGDRQGANALQAKLKASTSAQDAPR